jgi:hypothetical protein
MSCSVRCALSQWTPTMTFHCPTTCWAGWGERSGRWARCPTCWRAASLALLRLLRLGNRPPWLQRGGACSTTASLRVRLHKRGAAYSSWFVSSLEQLR